MPRIREYTSRVSPSGPVETRRARGADFDLGSALIDFGRSVGNTADIISKRAEQSEVSDLHAKMSEAHAKFTNHWRETISKADPGDKALTERFIQSYDEYMGQVGSQVSTRAGKNYFTQAQSQMRAHFLESAVAGQASLAGEKAVQDYSTSLNNFSGSLVTDPSGFDLAITQHKMMIENLVNNGSLPREAALKLETQGKQKLGRSAIFGLIQIDPNHGEQEINSGKWDQYLGADGKVQMLGEVTQAKRAILAEQERLKREQEGLLKTQREETQNKFLEKMTSNKLTAKEILNSNLEAFGSGSKNQFLNMLEENQKGGVSASVSRSTFAKLFERIHLPDNDPKKIKDENDLNQFVIARQLSFEDLNKLRGEMQGRKTEAGAIEADLKKGLIDIAKGKLTQSNPLLRIQDPVGDEQMQKFLSFFLQEYSEQRRQGKTAMQLLSPESSDYLGKHIERFTRTPQQIIKDLSRGASAPSAINPPPSAQENSTGSGAQPLQGRKPGESAADYLKRIGKD